MYLYSLPLSVTGQISEAFGGMQLTGSYEKHHMIAPSARS